MNNKLLISAGEALYGPRWQTDLSRDLSVSDRTMRRWTAGTDDVPEGAYRDLRLLLQTRWIRLREIERAIKDAPKD